MVKFIEFLGDWVTESVCPKMDSIIIEIPGSRLNAGMNLVNLIIPFLSTFLGISGIVYGMYQTSKLRRMETEVRSCTNSLNEFCDTMEEQLKKTVYQPPKSTFNILKSLGSPFPSKKRKVDDLFDTSVPSVPDDRISTGSGMETVSLDTKSSDSDSSCCCDEDGDKCECLK